MQNGTIEIEGVEVRWFKSRVQVEWGRRPKYTTHTAYLAYRENGTVSTDYKADMARFLRGKRDGFRGVVRLEGAELIRAEVGEDAVVVVRDYRTPGRRPAATYPMVLRSLLASANELGDNARMVFDGATYLLSNRGRWADSWGAKNGEQEFLPTVDELRRMM